MVTIFIIEVKTWIAFISRENKVSNSIRAGNNIRQSGSNRYNKLSESLSILAEPKNPYKTYIT